MPETHPDDLVVTRVTVGQDGGMQGLMQDASLTITSILHNHHLLDKIS